MALLMPLPLTLSCYSKIQIGFTFLVLAHSGSPRKKAVIWVCVICPNVTYDTLNFTMQQAGQTGECTALMSALNLH